MEKRRGELFADESRGQRDFGQRSSPFIPAGAASRDAWWMEAAGRPTGGGSALARGEGGAAAQVGQVRSLGSGVARAARSDCCLAGAGTRTQTLGPRIRLWEAGFVSQTLPLRKAMDRVRRLVVAFCVLSCWVYLVLPDREVWGKAACVCCFLERNKHVLCQCSTADTGLAPREGGTAAGMCLLCPVPTRRVRGQDALRNGGMRDPETSWVSDSPTACSEQLLVCLFAHVYSWRLVGVLGRGQSPGLCSDAYGFSVGSASY